MILGMLNVNLSSKRKTINLKFKLTNSFSEIDEYDIREHRESIPSTVYNDMATIPKLTRVAHSRLRQLLLVHLGLVPLRFF